MTDFIVGVQCGIAIGIVTSLGLVLALGYSINRQNKKRSTEKPSAKNPEWN